MPRNRSRAVSADSKITINLVDVGPQAYGDCILCQFGDINVLLDGAHSVNAEASLGHRSIPDQLAGLLGQSADSLHVDLLIVTHTHSDHYGCLPTLVGEKTLKADWALIADLDLGWGVVSGQTDAIMAAADPRALRLMDMFREDFPPDMDVRPLSDYAVDRVSDHDIYAKFVSDLQSEGGSVVPYADGPAATDLAKLIAEFATRGLKINILGPSRAQLTECAKGLAQGLGLASDFLRMNSPPVSTDAVADFNSVLADARSKLARGGNFVNLQSLVTLFEYAGKKFLFSGDMQTEDPTTKWSNIPISSILKSEVSSLRQQMMALAPYDFVKLGHHGSFNACSEQLLDGYQQTAQFGITVGEFSPTHPDPKTLDLLSAREDRIEWVRTDYNRLCGFSYAGTGAGKAFTETGSSNDAEKNEFDLGKRLSGAGGGSEDLFAQPVASSGPEASSPNTARIQARIPFGGATIDFQLTVTAPGAGSALTSTPGTTTDRRTAPKPVTPTPAPTPIPSLKGPVLGGGRTIPQLLFVTSRDQLANNVGRVEAQAALDAITKAGHQLLEDLPAGLKLSDTTATINKVRQRLKQSKGIAGVVLLGGYDVVPSRQLNTLPVGEEAHVAEVADPDKWIVWNDDEYGCTQQNGKVNYYALPVSRVPDQHYAPYFFNTLEAPDGGTSAYSGIRNLRRPFAAQVSPQFKDKAPLWISAPTAYTDTYDLTAKYVYFMLHGDALDSMEYVGETKDRHSVSAFRIDKVPDAGGCIVFAGCCWAALLASTPAVYAAADQPIGGKGRDVSIALRFLANGARAFVGCTGAHYSPEDSQPVASAGGAMHIPFWKHCLDPTSKGPADALRLSKIDYLAGMPYLPEVASSAAVDSKTLNQFTCLGLGW